MTVSLGTRAVATAATIFAPSLAIPPASASRPDHEAGDVLEEEQGHPAVVAELDEVGRLEGALAEEHSLVGEDADRVSVDVGEAADDRRRVLGLELVEAAAVDDASDHLARVVGGAAVGGHGAVERGWLTAGASTPGRRSQARQGGRQRGDDPAQDPPARRRRRRRGGRRPPRCARAAPRRRAPRRSPPRPVAAFTSGGPPRKIVPWSRTITGLVAHRRDVGAARRAGAHHRGQLRDPLRRHRRLVEEDAAEALAVGEDLVLHRQVGAARVDQVDPGQPGRQRHLLRPQVPLHRHRVVGAALDRGVVGDDDDLAGGTRPIPATIPAPARRRRDALGGERGDLQEGLPGRAAVDPLTRQQLARETWRARAFSPPPPAAARSSRPRSSPTSRRCSASFAANSALAGSTWLAQDSTHPCTPSPDTLP